MPDVGFGGSDNPNGWSGYSPLYSDGIGLPAGRAMANGSQACIITALSAYIGGRGGARNVQLVLGGSYSSGFVVGAAGPTWTGMVGSGGWLVQGGAARFHVYMDGSLNFLRGGGGTTTDGSGDTYSGMLGGSYRYVEAPSAPQSVSASPHPNQAGAIIVGFSGPISDGGSGVNGYTIYRNGTAVLNTGSGYNVITGNTPGTSYNFTVRARNWVTDAAGTESVNSNTATATAPGVPTAPRTLAATASTVVPGQINLTWTAPATTAGTITGYNIFRDGVQVASTSGTGLSYAVTGNTKFTSYAFTVKARNAFADTNNQLSPESNTATITAQGTPTAPLNFAGVANGTVPGQMDFTWSAPTTAGTGGITGYRIYYSTGDLAATFGNVTSGSVTGLNPGQVYSFYVRAVNALATASGTLGDPSGTITIQALGEPPAPTSLVAEASAAIPGRITLTWVAPAGTVTGYNIFDRNTNTNVDTLIQTVTALTYRIDGLTPGVQKTYVVRARNSYTDTLSTGYPGNWGGPASNAASAVPNADSVQTVPNLAGVTNITNATFNGTFTINAITPTTVRYAKASANVATVAVSAGNIANNTNAIFNGTYTIATPTPSSLTFARSAANFAANAASGTVTDNTNVTFNGTYTVTAVNVAAKTISYDKVSGSIATLAVPYNAPPGGFSVVSNQTNAVYNGTNLPIIGLTPTTVSYTKTNADLTESNAAGTVTDTTNRDVYNGTYTITGVPTYNTFTYTTTGANQATVGVSTPPGGRAYRAVSPAKLDIRYRSGWAG